MSSATGEMTLEGKVRAPASPYRDSIMFRANPDQEGLGTRKVLLRLDEEAVDHAQSKRELYWAGVLGETIAITVKTDPELPAKPLLDEHQHMLLTWHCLRDKRPMAQKVAERPDWPKLIPQLRGMMRASVLSAHPRELSRESLEFVGAHEVIIWQDGSMTTIEHSAAGVTGEFRDQRMLPHLPRAAQLLEHEELGPYGEPRDREPKDREQGPGTEGPGTEGPGTEGPGSPGRRIEEGPGWPDRLRGPAARPGADSAARHGRSPADTPGRSTPRPAGTRTGAGRAGPGGAGPENDRRGGRMNGNGRGSQEVRGLVWVTGRTDDCGDDDQSVERDGGGRISEIFFSQDDRSEQGYRSLRIDRDVFGPLSLRELHWCGLLNTPVALVVEEDADGRRSLHSFRRDTGMNTAQQLDRHPRALELLEDLRGLMQTCVLDCHPMMLPDGQPAAHEVIQWQDGSVTLIEHHAGETGAIVRTRILPPLPGLGALITPADGEQNWLEEQEQLINMGLVHLSSSRITSRMPLQGNHPSKYHLEALLMPAARLASDFRSGLADRQAAPSPAGPEDQD